MCIFITHEFCDRAQSELQRIVDDLEMKSAEPRPDLRMLNEELENASHPADAEDVGQYVRTIGREKAFSDGLLFRLPLFEIDWSTDRPDAMLSAFLQVNFIDPSRDPSIRYCGTKASTSWHQNLV